MNAEPTVETAKVVRLQRPEPDRAEAERFLLALVGSVDAPVTFQTYTDVKAWRDAKRNRDGAPWPLDSAGTPADPLASWKHGTLAQHWRWLVRMNETGAGVFVMVNEGNGKGRREANVEALRALFIDDDTGTLSPTALEVTPPSIVVSSRHGPHGYWCLQHGEPLSGFAPAQRQLAEALGTDTVIHDLPRVMRLPGFVHQKDLADPFLVTVVQANEARYTIAEVLAGYGGRLRSLPTHSGDDEAHDPTSNEVGSAREIDAVALERARDYLKDVPPAVALKHGDKYTYRVVAHVSRDLAVPDREALIALEEWDTASAPPWGPAVLRRFLAHVTKYGRHPRGAKLLQSTATETTPPLESRRITLARARTPPVERFLVGALFPFGKPSVLYGPTGAGKSAFLQGLAFKTASGGGGSFLGMLMHDQEGAPVLIYTAEDTFEDWERKAATILHGCPDIDMERALSRVHIIDKSEGEGRLTEMVQLRNDLPEGGSLVRNERRPTPERLALIDTARRLGARMIAIETASHLVDKEANEDFAALLAACGHVGAETGAAVILSHHPTKSAAENNDSSPEGARGGGAFINNARTAVSLFPAGEAVVASLQTKGLSFAAGDTLVLEHQKGTSSVPKQAPIVLVRCPTPFGAVLQTPELATANPERAREMAMRAERQARDLVEQREKLVDVVAEMRQAGPVSPRKIRDLDGVAAKIGIPVRKVEVFVNDAITAGLLVATRRDKNGRILELDIGAPPAASHSVRPACDPRLIDD